MSPYNYNIVMVLYWYARLKGLIRKFWTYKNFRS